jgi:hypothetical protein
MAVTTVKAAFVGRSSASIGLSQMFNVTAGSDPAYLVLTALDRNEYTAGASGAVGALSGNGHSLSLSSIGSDGRGAGIVFAYQAATGRYYNSTYGYFDQVTYISSGSLCDITNLSLFGTSNASVANAYAGNAYAMMQVDASGYLGSVTVATEPSFTATVPTQATPYSIAAIANSFVGKAWNMDGCWVLASTIAAEAGTSLPVQSTAIGVAGRANGEWIVAFNGPAGQSGNWQAMVHTGEIVVIGNSYGGGHITTCVSGSGSSAMLVDNITYVDGRGRVVNAANDGSSSDVVVAAPHPASQEWSGVQASSVVIYELDTPIVSTATAACSLVGLKTQALAPLFTAADPGQRSITSWQIYDTAATDQLLVNGAACSAHTASSAVTAASLSSVALQAGASATTDTLEVRAFNGLYWGDWQALSVTVTAPAPPALANQTANQSWLGGKPVSFALPANTFRDPQQQVLHYTATLANGQALPAWLNFNAATASFSGTAPLTAQTLTIKVTAIDSGSLSVSETFGAVVIGAPIVTAQTPSQAWQSGKPFSLSLAVGTFTDPQGQALHYTASLSNGAALPNWLTFNATTKTFTGTAPATAQSLSVKVTATDTSGLAASETFAASITPAPKISVTAQTAAQTISAGQAVSLALPATTFTDALGLKMTFIAYDVSGPDITGWLHFNAASDTFTGKAPANAGGTTWVELVASDAQHASAGELFPITAVPPGTRAPASLGAAPSVDPAKLTNMLVFHS